jgi:hypothetical protein
MLASYCINKGYREQKDAWMVAWELMKEMATLTPSESERCRHGVCKTDHCWKCDEAKRESIGFNEFLGQVQHRLIQDGYNPPIWPMPPIRDQGDLDSALDSCVQWCKDRLTPSATRESEGYPGIAHDLETFRTALVTIRDECFNGHAYDIAERALNSATESRNTQEKK